MQMARVAILLLLSASVARAQRAPVSVFDSGASSVVLRVPAWHDTAGVRRPQTQGPRFTRRRARIVLWSGYAGALAGATYASIHCSRNDSCLQPLNATIGGLAGFTGGILIGFCLAAIYRDPSDRAALLCPCHALYQTNVVVPDAAARTSPNEHAHVMR